MTIPSFARLSKLLSTVQSLNPAMASRVRVLSLWMVADRDAPSNPLGPSDRKLQQICQLLRSLFNIETLAVQ